MSALITPTGKLANNEISRNYLRKLLAERITNLTEPGYYNDDMARGHLLEPLARDLYSSHYEQVIECGFVKKDYGSFCIGFSPDGLIGDTGFFEIKSRLGRHHIASVFSREVPSEYVIQVQTGLAVSDREWAHYVSFTPGLPFLTIAVCRDEQLIKTIEAAAAQAEEQLQEMMERYLAAIELFYMPPTEPIQPEQEIIV